MNLTIQDFHLIRDLIYERTGLMFEDKKLTFMETRVVRRMEQTKCASPKDYYRRLKYSDPDDREFQHLIEQVTTNETYFFRDYPQLSSFADESLKQIAEAKRAKGDFTLNIWSACCSTGDEPYTIAIILAACLDDFPKWRIRLLATDIDNEVLRKAQSAEYPERNLKDVPATYIDLYFTRSGENYRVVDRIRQMVTFEHLNLMDRTKMRKQRGFDFLFCRNALIYFNDESRKQVLMNFYDALVPGGYVFLGHCESVGRISAAFEPLRLGNAIAYRKPHQTVTLTASK